MGKREGRGSDDGGGTLLHRKTDVMLAGRLHIVGYVKYMVLVALENDMCLQ